jgi:hypothetical protein
MQGLLDPESRAVSRSVMLQHFEEHGGSLHKVYCLGNDAEIQVRPSLTLSSDVLAAAEASGLLILPRLSTTPKDIGPSATAQVFETGECLQPEPDMHVKTLVPKILNDLCMPSRMLNPELPFQPPKTALGQSPDASRCQVKPPPYQQTAAHTGASRGCTDQGKEGSCGCGCVHVRRLEGAPARMKDACNGLPCQPEDTASQRGVLDVPVPHQGSKASSGGGLGREAAGAAFLETQQGSKTAHALGFTRFGSQAVGGGKLGPVTDLCNSSNDPDKSGRVSQRGACEAAGPAQQQYAKAGSDAPVLGSPSKTGWEDASSHLSCAPQMNTDQFSDRWKPRSGTNQASCGFAEDAEPARDLAWELPKQSTNPVSSCPGVGLQPGKMLQGRLLWAVAEQLSQQHVQGNDAGLLGQEPLLRTALTGHGCKVELPLRCVEHTTNRVTSCTRACFKATNGRSISTEKVETCDVPEWVAKGIVASVRAKTGLSLFNVDVICPVDQPTNGTLKLCVVDVNYFPGFDKLVNFEHRFVLHLCSVLRQAA